MAAGGATATAASVASVEGPPATAPVVSKGNTGGTAAACANFGEGCGAVDDHGTSAGGTANSTGGTGNSAGGTGNSTGGGRAAFPGDARSSTGDGRGDSTGADGADYTGGGRAAFTGDTRSSTGGGRRASTGADGADYSVGGQEASTGGGGRGDSTGGGGGDSTGGGGAAKHASGVYVLPRRHGTGWRRGAPLWACLSLGMHRRIHRGDGEAPCDLLPLEVRGGRRRGRNRLRPGGGGDELPPARPADSIESILDIQAQADEFSDDAEEAIT